MRNFTLTGHIESEKKTRKIWVTPAKTLCKWMAKRGGGIYGKMRSLIGHMKLRSVMIDNVVKLHVKSQIRLLFYNRKMATICVQNLLSQTAAITTVTTHVTATQIKTFMSKHFQDH